jgi:hypothetical protein
MTCMCYAIDDISPAPSISIPKSGHWTDALTYPSALGPSTSGGTLMTPRSRAALTASTSGPVFVLLSAHFISPAMSGA